MLYAAVFGFTFDDVTYGLDGALDAAFFFVVSRHSEIIPYPLLVTTLGACVGAAAGIIHAQRR